MRRYARYQLPGDRLWYTMWVRDGVLLEVHGEGEPRPMGRQCAPEAYLRGLCGWTIERYSQCSRRRA